MELDTLEKMLPLVSEWALKVMGGIALLIAGLVVARLARAGTGRAFARIDIDAVLAAFLARFVYYGVVVVVTIAVFGVVGVETASLITVLGASSLAIGLALQGSLSNFASGVMLLLFRPLRAGDYVEVGDFSGTVVEVGAFQTELDTLDNARVVVPNTYVSEHPVRNWSTNGTRRVDLEIEVSIESDLPTARRAIEQALAAEPRLLAEPAPMVAVSEFGDTSARLIVRPWCRHDDYWALRFELPERVKDAVEAAGCAMPCPQRDLRVAVTPAA